MLRTRMLRMGRDDEREDKAKRKASGMTREYEGFFDKPFQIVRSGFTARLINNQIVRYWSEKYW
jgi:hypothetical protein